MEPDISWSPFMVKVSSILGLEGHCSPRDDPNKRGALAAELRKLVVLSESCRRTKRRFAGK